MTFSGSRNEKLREQRSQDTERNGPMPEEPAAAHLEKAGQDKRERYTDRPPKMSTEKEKGMSTSQSQPLGTIHQRAATILDALRGMNGGLACLPPSFQVEQMTSKLTMVETRSLVCRETNWERMKSPESASDKEIKPVYLKELFTVATTTSKPPSGHQG
ncbi:hypothetical protein BD410DRAFT_845878 [Rickenella mellea]|uniref:Uncharacterized protein n=1 Tax=Rickenella mellea TaxID=50990 RepID=A0A4Y7PH64_9AGAM|nr:hypothetical protein BD410DRAFT_845878 [Rickenella mellea]